MMQWSYRNCNQASWTMKIDDDTIFNPFVFNAVFRPDFIEKSANLPLIIGRALKSQPVRTSSYQSNDNQG